MAKKKVDNKAAAGRISDMEAKKKALSMTMAHLEKDFGSGAIMRLGDDKVQDVESISTGSIGLDFALGIGGLPRGRITEIYGPESSGKTPLAIHVIAEAQKQGGICAIIDAEHA
ncbi:MAG: DNA recombination/repair protein RecA, partial [Muribaculaceae bacterium]|nr:DNA recombination/repair protein RecA [Muribaculaceae bacterium]